MNHKALVLVAALMPLSTLSAQTAPQIGYLFPAGAQRGTRVDVTVGGKYMPGPCGVWIGGQGVRSNTATTEGAISLNVDGDAIAGPRPIRIHSVQGGSSPRAFFVGDLPEVIENNDIDSPVVKPGTTINGRLNPKGDIDEYQMSLVEGQQIVCVLAMRTLGSPGDTILRVLDSKRRVLATGDNRSGLDPLLAWRCPRTGDFTLQVFDFNLAGGANYVYRLTVTDRPYLDYAFPAGAQRGVSSAVTLYGWNLPGNSLKYTFTGVGQATQLPGSTNQLSVSLSDFQELLEREPNDSLTAPQRIETSRVINGRFEQPGDVDTFEITGSKGDQFVIRVESSRLGFPTDPVLRVSKGDGALIRETDDVGTAFDPEYVFKVPADGKYLISLRERANRGGPRFIYRLHVVPPSAPTLGLTVKAAEYSIIPGESLTIPVRVNPLNGWDQEIELVATGLPTGVTAEVVKHLPKKAADVKLELKTVAGASFTSGEFQIVARTTTDKPSKPLAVARLAAAVGALPPESVPLWLAVRPKVPFELSFVATIQEAPRLSAFAFPVTVKRDEGFTGSIRLVGVEPDRRGTVIPIDGSIDANNDTGSIPLIIQSEAIEGTTHRCRVMGVVNVAGPDGKQHPVFHIAKGSMLMGCQPNLLTLTPTPFRIRWQPGASTKVVLTIERRAKFGDVTISQFPPTRVSGVSMKPVTIPTGKFQAEVELDIAADSQVPTEFVLPLQAESSRNGLPVMAQTEVRILSRAKP